MVVNEINNFSPKSIVTFFNFVDYINKTYN